MHSSLCVSLFQPCLCLIKFIRAAEKAAFPVRSGGADGAAWAALPGRKEAPCAQWPQGWAPSGHRGAARTERDLQRAGSHLPALCVAAVLFSSLQTSLQPGPEGRAEICLGFCGLFLLFYDLDTECPSLSRGTGLGVALMKVAQFLSTALKPGTGTGGSSPALALQAEARCRKVEVFPLSSFYEQSEICLGANRSSPVFSGVAVVCFGYISCLPLVSC